MTGRVGRGAEPTRSARPLLVHHGGGDYAAGDRGRSLCPVNLSETDLAILKALCGPYLESPSEFSVPASNECIRNELAKQGMGMKLDTLRGHLRGLYAGFGVEKALLPAAKRARLAELVRESGVIPEWSSALPAAPSAPDASAASAPPPPTISSAALAAGGSSDERHLQPGVLMARSLPGLAVLALLLVWGPWRSEPSSATTEPPAPATAVGAPLHLAYGQRIGAVCEEVNAADRARVRDLGPLDRRLRSAQTTRAQRDALLDATHHELARSIHALGLLDALDPPASLSSAHRATTRAWHANIARIQGYTARLNRTSNRRELEAAIRSLARERPRIERADVRITTGLLRLGETSCHLDTAVPSRTVTLPALAPRKAGTRRGRAAGSRSADSSGDGAGGARGSATRPSGATGDRGGAVSNPSTRAGGQASDPSPAARADATDPSPSARGDVTSGGSASDPAPSPSSTPNATAPSGGGAGTNPGPTAAAPLAPGQPPNDAVRPPVNPPSGTTNPGTRPPPPPP